MGVYHILYAVGNNITTGQRVQHTIVTHSNTVINSNSIEFGSIAAHLFDFLAHNLTNLVKMCMTGYKLGKRVHNGNNGFAKLLVFHTRGYPQCAGSSHSTSFSADCAA